MTTQIYDHSLKNHMILLRQKRSETHPKIDCCEQSNCSMKEGQSVHKFVWSSHEDNVLNLPNYVRYD